MAGMDQLHSHVGDDMINEHHQLIDDGEQHRLHVQAANNDMNHVPQDQVHMDNWAPAPGNSGEAENLKRVLIDLQRHWLADFQRQREKLLVDVTERLHEEFLADEEKTRAELVQQFKEELETTKEELDKKFRDSLKVEIAQLEENNKKQLASIKRQLWCWQCEKEAIYPCCWNTAYCGVDCQQAHWPMHKKNCRRKKGGGAPPR